MPVCAQCAKPLVIEVDSYDDDDGDAQMGGSATTEHATQTVPDEVRLACNDSFHWECLLEAYELSKCPKCSREITSQPPESSSSSATPQILVDLNNEGGLQQQIDIFPILKEETYLRAYPEERKSRAFLEFCREGDHRAIADLLKSCNELPEDDGDDDNDDVDEDAEPTKSMDEILRYQDPIGDMQSGLHAAAANGHREVAWLLLLLASEYPQLEFPPLVYQEAAALGIMREDQTGMVDIRGLTDANGRTAEDIARDAGVIWNGWIGKGRLSL